VLDATATAALGFASATEVDCDLSRRPKYKPNAMTALPTRIDKGVQWSRVTRGSLLCRGDETTAKLVARRCGEPLILRGLTYGHDHSIARALGELTCADDFAARCSRRRSCAACSGARARRLCAGRHETGARAHRGGAASSAVSSRRNDAARCRVSRGALRIAATRARCKRETTECSDEPVANISRRTRRVTRRATRRVIE